MRKMSYGIVVPLSLKRPSEFEKIPRYHHDSRDLVCIYIPCTHSIPPIVLRNERMTNEGKAESIEQTETISI